MRLSWKCLMIQKLIINKIIELLSRQFKLHKIMKYVQEPNELDNKVDNLNDRMAILEKMAHPKRDFVRCKECEERITNASKLMQGTGDESM